MAKSGKVTTAKAYWVAAQHNLEGEAPKFDLVYIEAPSAQQAIIEATGHDLEVLGSNECERPHCAAFICEEGIFTAAPGRAEACELHFDALSDTEMAGRIEEPK